MDEVKLKPGADRRVIQGHRWIFSNEVDGPLKDFEPGRWVDVVSSKGVRLGSGYINPHSLIAVRLAAPAGVRPDRSWLEERIRQALRYRQQAYPGENTYRLVYGESDGLPGLIVDRYEDVLVTQVTTAGMAVLEPMVEEVLADLLQPRAVVARNDTRARLLEGLSLEKRVVRGDLPESLQVPLHGLTLTVDPLNGQKTGLFLDQRDNREALRRWVKDAEVLDLFCYQGAWSLVAAASGARRVVGVDQSREAVDRAARDAAANGLEDRCRFHASDVLDFLKRAGRKAFDVVILDPPAFAKTKSALKNALRGYTDLNRRAMLALRPGGILVSCSCSYHVSEPVFQDMLVRAAQAAGRTLRLLEARGQALDHPVLAAMPETRYLKCHFLQVLDRT